MTKKTEESMDATLAAIAGPDVAAKMKSEREKRSFDLEQAYRGGIDPAADATSEIIANDVARTALLGSPVEPLFEMFCPASMRFDVLSALYDASRPLGMGHLQFIPGPLSISKEQRYSLENLFGFRVDYVFGRPIKVTFSGDKVQRLDLFDLDNGGTGTGERIVRRVFETLKKSE